jgi:hypothetical protein
MSKAIAKPNSSFLKKKNQKSGLLIGEIKVKSCVGMKLRKSATSAKSGTFSPEFRKKKPEVESKSASAAEPAAVAPAPAPAPAPSTGNILFDISTFSESFNVVTGYRKGQDNNDPNSIAVYEPLTGKAINALTRAANRWAHFLSFSQQYIDVIRKLSPSLRNWNGITLDRLKISNLDFFTNNVFGTSLAKSWPIIKETDTSFIIGAWISVSENNFNKYDENEWFTILSHELGHVLGFGTVTVKNKGVEYLPKKYVDLAPNHEVYKFYDEDHFPFAVDAYIKKYKGKTKERGNTTEQCNIDISPMGLIPLEWTAANPNNNYQHWSPVTLTYEESEDPNLYNPDACTNEYRSFLYEDDRPRVIFRGLYNELMVPGWNDVIDKKSGYFITEITLGALVSLNTPWNNDFIFNYKKLRGSEDTRFTLVKNDTTIHFSGNIIRGKEIKIEDEEEDKSWSKGTITHQCSVCKPIYLDACGDCV